jgi:hypothetical protein
MVVETATYTHTYYTLTGEARVYELSFPFTYYAVYGDEHRTEKGETNYIVAISAPRLRGGEHTTRTFPADRDGNVLVWEAASTIPHIAHAESVRDLGYVPIGDPGD